MPDCACNPSLSEEILTHSATLDIDATAMSTRYTISGWVAFFLVLGLAIVFWCIFKDPTEEERRRVLPPSVQTVDENAQV